MSVRPTRRLTQCGVEGGLTHYRVDEENPLGSYVKLIDLVPIIGQLPEEILHYYEELGILAARSGLVLPSRLYLNENGEINEIESMLFPPPDEEAARRVYIDRDWAHEILQAHEAGAVRVSGEWQSHPEPEKQCWSINNTLGCSFNDDGDCYVVYGIKADGTRIISGPRPERTWKQIDSDLDAEDAAQRVSRTASE